MFAVIGLGNPGISYEATRHNLGFMVVDLLGDRFGTRVKNVRWRSLTAKGMIEGKEIILMKPQLYMNHSGLPVHLMAEDLGIKLKDMLVVLDDSALPLGTVRLRRSGSSGGHNGLEDILAAFDTTAVPRLRLGVGAPPPGVSLTDFVLAPFKRGEREKVRLMSKQAVSAVDEILSHGFDEAMQRINVRMKEE